MTATGGLPTLAAEIVESATRRPTMPDLAVERAAAYADVTPRTIRLWVAESRLTGYRMGPRLIRADSNELDAMFGPFPPLAAMMLREKSRPEAALSGDLIATKSLDLLCVSPLDDIARHMDGAFVVVVRATGDRYRRRCYLSVKAAQNAAQGATDRGETATVYLAELKPLWKVRGGEPQ